MRDRLFNFVAFIGLALLTVAVSPLLLAMSVGEFFRRAYLRTWWHLKHGRYGRRWLAVYSDGVKWKEHFEATVLPLVGQSAVVVNTTSSTNWRHPRSLERLAHTCWSGRIEHTPILILFQWPFGKVQCLRLHEAYMANAKRGERGALDAKIQQLRGLLSEA